MSIHFMLSRHTKECDRDEVPVPEDTFKYIQLPIQSTTVDRVEDLCEDKSIEDQGLDNSVVFRVDCTVGGGMVAQNAETKKVENQRDDDLIS